MDNDCDDQVDEGCDDDNDDYCDSIMNVLDFEKEHYFEPTTVVHFATACSNRNHSAAFPLELPSWFIKLFTRKGDIVLDPFCGIGTSAMAAILLGRSYISIEISGEYIKQARKNIKQLKNVILK